MENYILTFESLSAIRPLVLNESTLGFTLQCLFEKVPFFNPEHFSSNKLNKIKDNIIKWEGTFSKAFGLDNVCIEIWLIDALNKSKELERHMIARLSDDEGKPLPVPAILATLFELDAEGGMTLSPPSEHEAIPEDARGHRVNFETEGGAFVWLSSHTLDAKELAMLFPDMPEGAPTSLNRGYQWEHTLHLESGYGLDDWFRQKLNSLKVRSVYTKQIRNDELELQLSLAGQGQKLASDDNYVGLAIDYISLFFDYKDDGMRFSGPGIRGHLNLSFRGHTLAPLFFDGRLHITTGQLDLSMHDFPSIGEIRKMFNVDSNADPTLQRLLDNIDRLAIREVNLSLDLFTLEVFDAGLKIYAKEPVDIGDHLKLYPVLEIQVSYPFRPDMRQVDLRVGGWAEAFGAVFSSYYTTADRTFFLSMDQGVLRSNQLLAALDLPSPPGFSITVMDLEFSASNDDGVWSYGGEITIENDWKFGPALLGMEMLSLHGEFQSADGRLKEFTITGQFKIGLLLLDASAIYLGKAGYSLSALVTDLKLDFGGFSHWLLGKDEMMDTTITNTLGSSIGMTVVIEKIMIDCFLPGNGKPELSFMASVKIDRQQELPLPLDYLFFELDWREGGLEWTALMHFEFKEGYKDAKGQEISPTDLFLKSQKKGDTLLLTGTLQNLSITDVFAFFKDRFADEKSKDDVPDALREAHFEKIEVSLWKTKDQWTFEFKCFTRLAFDEAGGVKDLNVALIFTVSKDAGGHWEITVASRAVLTLPDKTFFELDLAFEHAANNTRMLAVTSTNKTIDVGAIVAQLLPASVPSLTIAVKTIYFAFNSTTISGVRKTNLLVGAELDGHVSVSDIRLLQQLTLNGFDAGVNPLRVFYTTKNWNKQQLDALELLAKQIPNSPTLPLPVSRDQEQIVSGFCLEGTLKVGSFSKQFALGNRSPQSHVRTLSDLQSLPAAAPEATAALTKWFDVGKKLGPIQLKRVGIQFQYAVSKLFILLDAGLDVAVLSVSLDGFGVGSSLSEFKPELQLSGLGIDFHKGDLAIGGALAFEKPSTFRGMVSLRFKELDLSVLGLFRGDTPGGASAMFYGVLHYPIGGPPFFFVQGLAAGIGVRHKIKFPDIDKVDEFPLIQAAMPGATAGKDLTAAINALKSVMPPSAVGDNDYFFAAGVKFSTFKIIDSFVLLIVSLGRRVELDLLGYSVLSAPKPVAGSQLEPMAQARLMLHASFIPEAGTLKVEARLDPNHSYLFSRHCQLQGGFAFYAWFEGTQAAADGGKPGEFVLTLGGYHPRYKAPAHYPQVPRVGFLWSVDEHTRFKGEMYFALTPAHLMAGGMLEANWKDGYAEVSFLLALHLIIAWQPFHYDAYVGLTIKAGYHDGLLQFDGEVGAQMHIWGPEFGGIAHLKVLCLEIHVVFGKPAAGPPAPLTWDKFVQQVLPGGEQLVAVRIARGRLTGPPNDLLLGYVSPAGCEFVIETQLPFAKPFGIPAMGFQNVTSNVSLTITCNGKRVNDHFDLIPLVKSGPAALWATSMPDLDRDPIVEGLTFGYILKPSGKTTGFKGKGHTLPTDSAGRTTALYDAHTPPLQPGIYTVEVAQTTTPDDLEIPVIRKTFTFHAGKFRYGLGPEEIQGVFPPRDSAGPYAHVLPHVMLHHSILPWEVPFPGTAKTDAVPALALMLVDESEDGLITKEEKSTGNEKETSTLLTVPGDLFHKLFSLPGTLTENRAVLQRTVATLAHARITGDAGTSCLLANRLPRTGSTTVVYVVSFALSPFAVPAEIKQDVQLYALYSFRFHTDPAGQGDPEAMVSRLPGKAAWIHASCADETIFATAGQKQVRYDGPLVSVAPAHMELERLLPANAAKKLELNTGSIRNITYAAAWTLGEYFALSTSTFRKELTAWIGSHIQKEKSERIMADLQKPSRLTNLRTGAALGLITPQKTLLTAGSPGGDVVKKQLHAWMCLDDMPLHYLVPAGAWIPQDSLRFFVVDELWMKAFIGGVYSIGIADRADGATDTVWNHFWNVARADWPGGNAPAGCLIHSDLIAHVPDLQITAGGKPPFHLKKDGSLLLALFEGEVHELRLALPAKDMHVHLQTGETDAHGVTPLQLALKDQQGGGRNIDVPYYPATGVIDIQALMAKPEFKGAGSADLAYHGMKKAMEVDVKVAR